MHSKLFIVTLLLISTPALAKPVELSCYWGEATPKPTGMAQEMAKFYSKPSEAMYFLVDVEDGKVTHNDAYKTQGIFFRGLHLVASSNTIKIIITSLNVAELKDTPSGIDIEIDRYTLKSTMALQTPTPSSKRPVLRWLRDGQCSLRKF
jgi:hypothetical protein